MKSSHVAVPLSSNSWLPLIASAAAFGTYFSMFAFRKPFTVATYDAVAGWDFAIDYKSMLLIAQVVGYGLAKLIGIRVIAEFGRAGRARALLALIAVAWLALVLFALLPPPWTILCLFLNGLPLGMIWGLVFSYVEGRRTSELIGAILCSSFILSSGVVKSVGAWLLEAGIDPPWMPAAAGAIFVPLLCISVWGLSRIPPPDHDDEVARTIRMPMSGADRIAFLRDHGVAIVPLVIAYLLVTALRDFRDNFAAEIWQALGYAKVAAIFSQSELPVALIVLAGLASLMAVRDNRLALLAIHGVILSGAVLLGGSTLAFSAGWLSPLAWMIMTGAGLYLVYTPFNAMLFDRIIAVIGRAGTAVFLIYLADSLGYIASISLLLYKSLAVPHISWLAFFKLMCYAVCLSTIALTAFSALCFSRKAT